MALRPPKASVKYDGDADLAAVRSRRVGVIGYGSQGRAHALNLRDSGCEVRVGLRPGSESVSRVTDDGLQAGAIDEVAGWANLVSFMLPDQIHRPVFERYVGHHLAPGDMFLVAHGLSIMAGWIQIGNGVDVALVAPVGPGRMVRKLYLEGFGVPALVAVERDASGQCFDLALSYARALGCTRAGVLPTTFREETETDLFGEQAVLCGGLTALITAGFDTLVEAGYQPEIAYFECLHQVKLIVDLLYEGGLSALHGAISDTAAFGQYVTGPRVIDEHVREAMRAVLQDIQQGNFAQRWAAEAERGAPSLERWRSEESNLLIEQVGRNLRSMMQPGNRE